MAGSGGKIEPSPLYNQLLEAARDIRPKMIGIASSANVFAGNENDRAQVQQFVGLLTGLAIAADGAVQLISHPSLSGISAGTGVSGTTQWHNAVRARSFLKGIKPESGDQPDNDLREIIFKKNNYGPLADTIVLRYQNGLFLPVTGAGTLEKVAREKSSWPCSSASPPRTATSATRPAPPKPPRSSPARKRPSTTASTARRSRPPCGRSSRTA